MPLPRPNALIVVIALGIVAAVAAILSFGHAPPSGAEVAPRATAACERTMRESGMLAPDATLAGEARPRVDATVRDARVFLVAGVLAGEGGAKRAYLCTWDSRDGTAAARWAE